MRGVVFGGVVASAMWLSGQATPPDASKTTDSIPLPDRSRNFVLSTSNHGFSACQVSLAGAAGAGEIQSDSQCLDKLGIGGSTTWRFAETGDMIFEDASGKVTMQFAQDELDGYLSSNRGGGLLQLVRR